MMVHWHWLRGLGMGRMVVMMVGALAWDAPAQAPRDLVVGEGFSDPLGFHDASPVFSWKLPASRPGIAQRAYQVVVASSPDLLPDRPDLWDSGRVASAQSVDVAYQGAPLNSRQALSWQVRCWDEEDEPSAWSAPARMELGLLANADWEGQWIRVAPDGAGTEPAQPAKIVIERAVYGVADDDARQVDLTEMLRERVARGESRLLVDNDLAGTDPAYGTVKILRITYRRDGELVTSELREGTRFDLARGEEVTGSTRFIPEYLRKSFRMEGGVARARLYITARGLYEAYLNGRRVGEDCLAPGFTPYGKRIETLTYDVTDQVQAGENVLGVVLGEGWYAGALMGKREVYPDRMPHVLVQLEVTGADGETRRIVSDPSWRGTREGPIRFSGIYDGETYDARREMPGWNRPGFDDAGWRPVIGEPLDPAVTLAPKRHHPVRAIRELRPIGITEPAPGRFVFDLGQNMVGWPRLQIPVQRNVPITVRFAEMLQQDGTLYTENYRGARSTDQYTAAETGTVTWQPAFTFHGFRYVELSGFPDGARPANDWVTGVVLHSDFPEAGTFASSHAKLNQLHQNTRWGLWGNFLDIPTDCPQRDERLGWTGDAQVFAPISLFLCDVHSFWMSWLQSMREDQHPDGAVPNVVPNVLNDHSGGPGWADAATVIPWELYVRTGDRNALAENFDLMRGWVGWYASEARDFIVDVNAYGDWLQPYPLNGRTQGDTPRTLIGTAYFAHSADLTARAARLLDQPDEAARLEELARQVRDAFTRTFFDDSGRLTTDPETQTGYLLALGFDLLPEAVRPAAAAHLVRLVEAADGHLRTGFLGTPLLAPVLDRFGYIDLAYGALFKDTYPSWFFSIDQGATTMWERWNSYSHADGFGDAGMNSFNHYAYGAIGQWMVERIAGLAPDPAQPGYKHFFIQPIPGGPLTSASAEYETRYGTAQSGWSLQDQLLTLHVTIPPNTTATVVFPAGTPNDIRADNAALLDHPRLLHRDTNANGLTTATFPAGTYTFTTPAP
jgi:alpha-L-rhamnosidase